MERMIDADVASKRFRRWLEGPHEATEYNAGFGDAIWHVLNAIEHMPTLTPPNEPLTLEELREMSGQPFWDDAGSVWWIVAHVEGSKIYTEEGAILDFYEEGEEDVYFRRPPEGEGET